MDPEVDGDVLALHEPDGDVTDLRRGGGAGDVVALAAAVVDADHADVLELGEQRLPAVLRIEELRGVDVVPGGQGLEVARHGVGDPHLVGDGDRAETCGEVVVHRHLELGLCLAWNAELAAQRVECDAFELVDENRGAAPLEAELDARDAGHRICGGFDDRGGLRVGVGDCIVVGDLLAFGRRRIGVVTAKCTEGDGHHEDHGEHGSTDGDGGEDGRAVHLALTHVCSAAPALPVGNRQNRAATYAARALFRHRLNSGDGKGQAPTVTCGDKCTRRDV